MRAAARARALDALAGVIGLLFALPLLYVVLEASSNDVAELLTARSTREPALRSFVLAASVAVSCAVTGTALAWFTERTDLPLRRLWRTLAPLPLVIPSFVGASALLAAFARGGFLDDLLQPLGVDELPQVRGFWAAFAVLTLLSYPYVYLPVAARLRGLPASLEESARLLGRRTRGVVRTVVLPQTAPAIAAGSLLVFLYSLSDFGAVSLLRYRTLTDRIFANKLVPEISMTLGVVLGALALAVVLAERALARRTQVVPATSSRPLVVRLGRGRAPALAAVAGLIGLALGAPLAVLGYWAQRGFRGEGSLLGTVGGGVEDLPELIRNSATAGVVTAVAAVALVLPVAYSVARRHSRTGGVAQTLVTSGFALPGLVGALALTRFALDAPVAASLYQTFPLLIAAYVLHFGAQASQAAQVAVEAVPATYGEAARMLGAGRARVLLTVDLPLMAPGLLAGAGLVLLSTMKELPATLLLAPLGFQTLATRVWLAANDGFLAEAGAVSLVLVGLSGLLTWVLVIRRGERVA